jgi:hypothetical protein
VKIDKNSDHKIDPRAQNGFYNIDRRTPLVRANMMGPPPPNSSSISGSVRDESPEETFSSSPATSPLLQINQVIRTGAFNFCSNFVFV